MHGNALDVADHLVGKLAALGNADAQLDTWLDQVLAKVPETATVCSSLVPEAASSGNRSALARVRPSITAESRCVRVLASVKGITFS